MKGMRIVIAGSSGFIGTAVVDRLRSAGHDVVRLVRRDSDQPDEVPWRPMVEPLDPSVVDGADAAINLAGAGVGDHRWNDAYKALLRASRLSSTEALATAIAGAAAPPRVLLNGSAIGFYGDTGDTEVDESAPPGDGFFPDLCEEWEAATGPAEAAGIRVAHLRTGLVLGPNGGLLRPLARPFRFGVGGRLGDGRQWFSWVSLADVLAAIEFLLAADEVTGAVNVVGPAPVRNTEFTRTLASVLHRPALFPVPAFALRVVLGEFAVEVLRSQRVLPAVLTGAGYRFTHPDLATALRWSLGR
jgi:uncharacterized protein